MSIKCVLIKNGGETHNIILIVLKTINFQSKNNNFCHKHKIINNHFIECFNFCFLIN